MNAQPNVNVEMMIPDLVRQHPACRAVLDRYGLKGCGGPYGPVESIAYFARAHDVDVRQLLSEFDEAIAKAALCNHTVETLPNEAQPTVADTIYRRFFVAGIAIVLTFGASWGAWLLWRIGLGGAFDSVPATEVNAHAQAQIFGWVGMFIMGFAYQAFPRFWMSELVAPRLAVTAFVCMLGGVIASTIGITLQGYGMQTLTLATIGGAAEVIASLMFACQLVVTLRVSRVRIDPYIGFILVALGWFVVSTLASAWHTWNTMTIETPQQLTLYVQTFQSALRDIQIHGLAMTMILGVSLRTLPHLFGLPKISRSLAWSALVMLTVAVIAETCLSVASRITQSQTMATWLMVPWLMLTVSVAMIVLPWKLWRPFPEPDCSSKFIRAAYGWLTISLVMLILTPAYQAVSHVISSHAYFGAIRHAITVGFISLMIMGYSAKVVPTLNGIDPRKLSQLWGPFILVNLGCCLRVVSQTLTDWLRPAFAVVGLSGTLEVIGLAWWGIHILRVIWAGKLELCQDSLTASSPTPECIEPGQYVADVLAWFPETKRVFEQYGFQALNNPVLRRTVARHVTLAKAAAMHNISESDFLQSLNEVRVKNSGQLL